MKKYRIKTIEEFEEEFKTKRDGSFQMMDGVVFSPHMHHLCGVEISDKEARKILDSEGKVGTNMNLKSGPAGEDNSWTFTPDMIIEVKESGEYTQTITRKALQSIHRVACETWKTKIEKMVTRHLFDENIVIANDIVYEMFKASNESQKAVLHEAGLVDKPTSKYAKLVKNLGKSDLDLLRLPGGVEISIGGGLVSDEYKNACLIPLGDAGNQYVPEVQWCKEGRAWVIVFKEK